MELQEIKELLDANTKVLSTKIDMNREIFSVKFKELKEDTQDIKEHAKETNGQVNKNANSILILEEKQYHETKRRKHVLAVATAALGAAITAIISFFVNKAGG
jgi:predicted nucleotide-binding protein (sugar kinase/HSP70/actin superfamily)